MSHEARPPYPPVTVRARDESSRAIRSRLCAACRAHACCEDRWICDCCTIVDGRDYELRAAAASVGATEDDLCGFPYDRVHGPLLPPWISSSAACAGFELLCDLTGSRTERRRDW